MRLGLDLFSVRTQKWSPYELLDYTAKENGKVAFFSEPQYLGPLEPESLKRVREHADKLGVQCEVGMRSICPSSKTYVSTETPEQQVEKMIMAAKIMGSPFVRCFLGSSADRAGGAIDKNIEETVKQLKKVRSRVVDAGLKMAIENHAGDMQAREVKMLVEEAGKDFVGVCLDTGNPLWALEDPLLTLETLAPYVLTSHVRDSYLWKTEEGIVVRWVPMGEGNINIEHYLNRQLELCPKAAVCLEIIVTGPRVFKVYDPAFWDAYRKTPAWEFARFASFAEKGTPQNVPPTPKEEAAAKERADVAKSFVWTRNKYVG